METRRLGMLFLLFLLPSTAVATGKYDDPQTVREPLFYHWYEVELQSVHANVMHKQKSLNYRRNKVNLKEDNLISWRTRLAKDTS
jgi:hypothetical protein